MAAQRRVILKLAENKQTEETLSENSLLRNIPPLWQNNKMRFEPRSGSVAALCGENSRCEYGLGDDLSDPESHHFQVVCNTEQIPEDFSALSCKMAVFLL